MIQYESIIFDSCLITVFHCASLNVLPPANPESKPLCWSRQMVSWTRFWLLALEPDRSHGLPKTHGRKHLGSQKTVFQSHSMSFHWNVMNCHYRIKTYETESKYSKFIITALMKEPSIKSNCTSRPWEQAFLLVSADGFLDALLAAGSGTWRKPRLAKNPWQKTSGEPKNSLSKSFHVVPLKCHELSL